MVGDEYRDKLTIWFKMGDIDKLTIWFKMGDIDFKKCQKLFERIKYFFCTHFFIKNYITLVPIIKIII